MYHVSVTVMDDTDANNSFLPQSLINYPGIKEKEIACETKRTKHKSCCQEKHKKDNKRPCFDPVIIYLLLKEIFSTNHHSELSQCSP